MEYYYALDDPQNLVQLDPHEGVSSDPKTQAQYDDKNSYLSQNIISAPVFATNPTDNQQKNTDFNCQTSNVEYSTASNYPQPHLLQKRGADVNQELLNEESLLSAKNRGKSVIVCEFPNCGKKFSYLSELKRHSTIHCKDQSFVCSTCQKSFTRADNLKAHERLHTDEKPYLCEFPGCGQSFKSHSSLKNHRAIHTNTVEVFFCIISGCNKKLKSKKELEKHYMFSHQKFPEEVEKMTKSQMKSEETKNDVGKKGAETSENSNLILKDFISSIISEDSEPFIAKEKNPDVIFDEFCLKRPQR